MSFLWTNNLPFDKTALSNDKTKVSCTEQWARKIFGTSYQNHGLTRLKICEVFAIVKCRFQGLKKPPLDKTTSIKDKTKVSFT